MLNVEQLDEMMEEKYQLMQQVENSYQSLKNEAQNLEKVKNVSDAVRKYRNVFRILDEASAALSQDKQMTAIVKKNAEYFGTR